MGVKVSEITVSLGVTKSLGKGSFEFARIDISNKAVLDEPLETGTKEYRTAHRELWQAVDQLLTKATLDLVPTE